MRRATPRRDAYTATLGRPRFRLERPAALRHLDVALLLSLEAWRPWLVLNQWTDRYRPRGSMLSALAAFTAHGRAGDPPQRPSSAVVGVAVQPGREHARRRRLRRARWCSGTPATTAGSPPNLRREFRAQENLRPPSTAAKAGSTGSRSARDGKHARRRRGRRHRWCSGTAARDYGKLNQPSTSGQDAVYGVAFSPGREDARRCRLRRARSCSGTSAHDYKQAQLASSAAKAAPSGGSRSARTGRRSPPPASTATVVLWNVRPQLAARLKALDSGQKAPSTGSPSTRTGRRSPPPAPTDTVRALGRPPATTASSADPHRRHKGPVNGVAFSPDGHDARRRRRRRQGGALGRRPRLRQARPITSP